MWSAVIYDAHFTCGWISIQGPHSSILWGSTTADDKIAQREKLKCTTNTRRVHREWNNFSNNIKFIKTPNEKGRDKPGAHGNTWIKQNVQRNYRKQQYEPEYKLYMKINYEYQNKSSSPIQIAKPKGKVWLRTDTGARERKLQMFECSLVLFLPENLHQTRKAPSKYSTFLKYKLPMPTN